MFVNGLGLTFHVNINLVMKFIYTSRKCFISIYTRVSVNVKPYKSILYSVKQSKCKNKYIYMVLHSHVKQCKKCNFYLGKGGGLGEDS